MDLSSNYKYAACTLWGGGIYILKEIDNNEYYIEDISTFETPTHQGLAIMSQSKRLSSLFSKLSTRDTDKSEETITLDRCRACSDCFQYIHNRWTTNVIAGVPKTSNYKAVSYVWGQTKQLPLKCSQCGNVARIPMESAEKFRRLMTVTDQPGDNLWLDALSIDQSDPKDVATQMAVMGDIFSRARSVAVLFPKSDGEAFRILERLGDLASFISVRKAHFDKNEENKETASLSEKCKEFFALVEELDSKIDGWSYFRRAWTFQEWALSYEISVSWEGNPQLINLSSVKGSILQAATMMAIYKLTLHQYAVIDVGVSRGLVPRIFQKLKRIFPDETGFLPPDSVDESKVAFQAVMPNFGFDHLLGLRKTTPGNPAPYAFDLDSRVPSSKEERFKERLSMAFNALGTGEREASFEADLVASWASMCNIEYGYKKEDSFAAALQKVLKVLRGKHEVTIYNFLVNTQGNGGTVDISFLSYATAHQQCNATNVGFFYGSPVITGRADTAIHLRNAILQQPREKPTLNGPDVKLRRVKNSSIKHVVQLTDTDAVLDAMAPAVTGLPDGMIFKRLETYVKETIEKEKEAAKDKVFVAACIDIKLKNGALHGMYAWAVCPDRDDTEKCIVARTDVNGTLVLAAPRVEKGGYEVVAYLTISDHQCGTFLVKIGEYGDWNQIMVSPMRGDVLASISETEREMVGKFGLEEDAILAF